MGAKRNPPANESGRNGGPASAKLDRLGPQTRKGPDSSEASAAPPEQVPDDPYHRAARRAADGAEAMRQTVFPSIMAHAIGYAPTFDAHTYKVFLEQLILDCGDPTDPIARMMIEQLALAHFRIAQLQAGAATSSGSETAKIYNSAACRLLGEFRRTALAVQLYRTSPAVSAAKKIKIFNAAQ